MWFEAGKPAGEINRKSRSSICRRVVTVLFACVTGVVVIADVEHLGHSRLRRYDQNTFLGSHNSYANVDEHYRKDDSNQVGGIKDQLDGGVRCLSLDIYLLRQYATDWEMKMETYDEHGAYLTPGDDFEDEDLEISLAHEPNKWGYSLFVDYLLILRPYENVYSTLVDVKEWLDDNLTEVVTINFESYVHESPFMGELFQASGLLNMIFYADRPNSGIRARDGAAWNVPVHGWPTLNEMVNAGKRLVIFSSNGVEWQRYSGQPIGGAKSPDNDGMPYHFNFWLENVYGTAGLQGEVGLPRRGPLTDMSYALTWMNWFPDYSLGGPDLTGVHAPLLGFWNFGRLNDSDLLGLARDNFADAAMRYPNVISVDFYHKGGAGGPREVVRECNQYWANRPVVTTALSIFPEPNELGWHNSADVEITARGIVPEGQGSPFWINYYWHGGHDVLGHAETNGAVFTGSQPLSLVVTNGSGTADGVFRVSAEAVSNYGDRSDREVMWVRVDTTPPQVNPTIPRPPDGDDGWYNRSVTIEVNVLDLVSGARLTGYKDHENVVHTATEYGASITNQSIQRRFDFNFQVEGNQFVRFFAEDLAGNTNPENSGFIQVKLDQTPPVSTVESLVPGAESTAVTLAASDTLSGLAGIWFKLDDSADWQLYSEPISISSSPHQLHFYARDVAGNMEPAKTYSIGQTAVSIESERNPAGYYQALRVWATVMTPGGAPSGTVTFYDGTNIMGSVDLDANGVAQITLSPIGYRLEPGTHELSAHYNGSGSSSPADSAPLLIGVVDAPFVRLTSSTGRAVETQPVILNAAVTPRDDLIPSGMVKFRVLNGVSGREVRGLEVPLDETGSASAELSDLPLGYYILFAAYAGDEKFPPGESGGALELFIDAGGIELSVTSSPNPSRFGEPVTITMDVSPTPGAVTPEFGSVQIDLNDSLLQLVPLDGKTEVTYTTSSLPVGDNTLLFTTYTMPNVGGGIAHLEHMVLPAVINPPTFRGVTTNESGTVSLALDVLPGQKVEVESSSDLQQWSSVGVGTNTGAVLIINDESSLEAPGRFYRARLAP